MLSWRKSIVHCPLFLGRLSFSLTTDSRMWWVLSTQTDKHTNTSFLHSLPNTHTTSVHGEFMEIIGHSLSHFTPPCCSAIKDGEVGLKAAAAWYSYPLLVFFCSPEIINFKTSHFGIPALKWLTTNSQKAKARSFTWSFPNTLKTRQLATKPQYIKEKIQTGGICINVWTWSRMNN